MYLIASQLVLDHVIGYKEVGKVYQLVGVRWVGENERKELTLV